MLKVKEIKKEGKYLKIIIKQPRFQSFCETLILNGLIFPKGDIGCLEPGITRNGDIELTFILRNWEDFKPYMKTIKEMGE